MKNIALFLVLVSSLCFGSGKLSVSPALYPGVDKLAASAGLAIYEPLFLGLNYNGWSGFGWQPRKGEATSFWATSRHDIETWIDRVGVGFGFTYRHASQPGVGELDAQSDLHCKLQYKLW